MLIYEKFYNICRKNTRVIKLEDSLTRNDLNKVLLEEMVHPLVILLNTETDKLTDSKARDNKICYVIKVYVRLTYVTLCDSINAWAATSVKRAGWYPVSTIFKNTKILQEQLRCLTEQFKFCNHFWFSIIDFFVLRPPV